MTNEADPTVQGLWDEELRAAPVMALPLAIGLAGTFIGATAVLAFSVVALLNR